MTRNAPIRLKRHFSGLSSAKTGEVVNSVADLFVEFLKGVERAEAEDGFDTPQPPSGEHSRAGTRSTSPTPERLVEYRGPGESDGS